MRFTLKQDMKIVRKWNKIHINTLASQLDVTPKQLQERIDFLYSSDGKTRLESAQYAINRDTYHIRNYHNQRAEIRKELREQSLIRSFKQMLLLPSPHTVPIKNQHIDKEYIKGDFQAEYLKMRQRERRSNDTARDIFV